MPRFQAVLFDFDGVLLDSEPVHCAAWNEVLAPFGVHMNWPEYRERFLGMNDRDMIHVIARESDPPVAFESLWEKHPAKKEAFRRIVGSAPPFPPGLGQFLDGLRPEYRLAVVSSSAHVEVVALLEMGGLRERFDAVVCGADVARRKPAPDPYLHAAKLLGVERALVVEDSPVGVASGRAAGFDVLLVSAPEDVPALVLARLSS